MPLKINYQFKNQSLLNCALTHPSMSQENEISQYERMEFLGDKILGAIMAEIIYYKFPNYSEGEMSIAHSNLVNGSVLAKIAEKISLNSHMIFALGEKNNGGGNNPKNLANCMEALIAAIYLDSNYQVIFQVVKDLWEEFINTLKIVNKKDSRTLLQEHAQKRYQILPEYKLEDVFGNSHAPIFTMSVCIKEKKCVGKGQTKKIAIHNAATKMIKLLKINS